MTKWKAVFWIAALLFLLQLLSIPTRDSHNVWGLVGLFVGGIALISLYGFSHRVPIGNKYIAIVIFLVNGVVVVPTVYFVGAIFVLNPTIIQFIFSGLGMLIVFVFYYPLYAYAFRSNDLWQGAT